MKSLIGLLLLTLALSGCAEIHGGDINKAYEYCADKRGVDYYYPSSNYIRCNDGSHVYAENIKTTKEN